MNLFDKINMTKKYIKVIVIKENLNNIFILFKITFK